MKFINKFLRFVCGMFRSCGDEKFVSVFQWRYHSVNIANAKFQLPHALDDVFVFLNDLQRAVAFILDDAQSIFGHQAKEVMFLLI